MIAAIPSRPEMTILVYAAVIIVCLFGCACLSPSFSVLERKLSTCGLELNNVLGMVSAQKSIAQKRPLKESKPTATIEDVED